MKEIAINTPLTKNIIKKLKAGQKVLLSGVVLTARDAAHKKIQDFIKTGKRLPLNLKNAVIYYCGPTPGRSKKSAGSCGPTTSSRMDPFTSMMLRLGVTAMIGKGKRSGEVKRAMKKNGAVYFLATGGIGALLSTKVKSSKPVLFMDLGPEAIYKMEVKDFPLMVGIDSKGRDIYDKAGWQKK